MIHRRSRTEPKLSEQVTEMVTSVATAVSSGRLGFDYAIKEYVDISTTALGRALQSYVEALDLGPSAPWEQREQQDSFRLWAVRCNILSRIARDLAVPEFTAFVDAVIDAQESGQDIPQVLNAQARKLNVGTR